MKPQRGTLWRESPVTTAFFYMSLEFLNKNSANKNRNFSRLSKALGKERPRMFPKTEPLWKQTPISRTLLGISFGVPSKGALPPGSPHRTPTERDAPFPEPSFIHLSKSPLDVPPSWFPISHVTDIISSRMQNYVFRPLANVERQRMCPVHETFRYREREAIILSKFTQVSCICLHST